MVLATGAFLGSWIAASASSLGVDGGVLQTWSYTVDLGIQDPGSQPSPIQASRPAEIVGAEPTETQGTVDPDHDLGADEVVTAEDVSPPSELMVDIAGDTAPPPGPAPAP
ncbi:hypothetical protein [Ornithinimicrobium avium]|uniref:Uncharacterized protein n=1 Tax=Ornithinimicrobium avium TaxID=2283195 RepID=A0A345NMV8_9MICO|nr:hypothetical protein [Ornithinimicrobium avium]AXH96366.1 hypothetical protein DV701_09765 [Ornithinimicrobium avium]